MYGPSLRKSEDKAFRGMQYFSTSEYTPSSKDRADFQGWDGLKYDLPMREDSRVTVTNVTSEMQIKTTTRDHLTLVRMAAIQKSTSNKCWSGCRENGALLRCW